MQNGVTALHRAAIDGHADVARALLDSGCSMDKKDEVIVVAKDLSRGGDVGYGLFLFCVATLHEQRIGFFVAVFLFYLMCYSTWLKIMAGKWTMCGQNDLSIHHFKNEKETVLSKTKTYGINRYWG